MSTADGKSAPPSVTVLAQGQRTGTQERYFEPVSAGEIKGLEALKEELEWVDPFFPRLGGIGSRKQKWTYSLRELPQLRCLNEKRRRETLERQYVKARYAERPTKGHEPGTRDGRG